MTDKHTNSFEERNFQTQQDQADFRMQQMLKEKGFVRGATDKELEKYEHIAGSYQKVGTDPKDGYVPRFYDVRKVLLIPDYVIYPRDSLKLYLSEVKGTNKLKEDDYETLIELQERALSFNEMSNSITMEVGLWWFPNPSKNKIGKYYSYSSIEKQWMSNENWKVYEGEKDSKGNPKRYKEMSWKL
tara:strand:- start:235 stop:792 length:558 start_codon:yes stop_codon:yes gene_type:complete